MIEQNNVDLMQMMIKDHHARLRAAYQPRELGTAKREPGKLRASCGRMLIQLGERVRGAQPVAGETPATRLATR